MIFLVPRDGILTPEVCNDFKLGRVVSNPNVLSVFSGYDLLGYIDTRGKNLVEVLDHNCIKLIDTIPTDSAHWFSAEGFKKISNAMTVSEYDNFHTRFSPIASAFNSVVEGKKSFNEFQFDFSEANMRSVLYIVMGSRFMELFDNALPSDVVQ